MDGDLVFLTRGELIEEVKRLRDGIRAEHRAGVPGVCLCRQRLYALLPERSAGRYTVVPHGQILPTSEGRQFRPDGEETPGC